MEKEKKCCHNADCDGFASCEECWADWREQKDAKKEEIRKLIERLRRYSIEAYAARNAYAAGDLKNAADVLEQMLDHGMCK